MSMLSAQCDELRTLADLYDILHKPANARTLRDAAETILSLRDRAQDLQAENAKLRELVRYAYECAIHSDHATCDDCRRMNSSCILADRMRELGVEVDGGVS